MVQWLRFRAPNAGGLGSIPGQGTRSRMPQLRPGAAKFKKKNVIQICYMHMMMISYLLAVLSYLFDFRIPVIPFKSTPWYTLIEDKLRLI